MFFLQEFPPTPSYACIAACPLRARGALTDDGQSVGRWTHTTEGYREGFPKTQIQKSERLREYTREIFLLELYLYISYRRVFHRREPYGRVYLLGTCIS